MNLRQLEYFISVAETLSFTKTAERFFISQTAITQQIKVLEKQLDVILLERTKRHVELTPAGAVFLNEARAILARTENAIERTKKTATGFFGTLHLGIIEGYENGKIPDAVCAFRTRYPNISLSIIEAKATALYHALENQEVDVVINLNNPYAQLDTYGIVYKTLGYYSLIVHLPSSHPLAFRNVLDLSELQNEIFIFTETQPEQDSFGHYKNTMSPFIKSGFTPNIVHISENFRTTSLMVAANMGVALLPSYALSGSTVLHHSHVKIPLNDKTNQVEIVMAWSKQNKNPIVEKFLSYF